MIRCGNHYGVYFTTIDQFLMRSVSLDTVIFIVERIKCYLCTKIENVADRSESYIEVLLILEVL